MAVYNNVITLLSQTCSKSSALACAHAASQAYKLQKRAHAASNRLARYLAKDGREHLDQDIEGVPGAALAVQGAHDQACFKQAKLAWHECN